MIYIPAIERADLRHCLVPHYKVYSAVLFILYSYILYIAYKDTGKVIIMGNIFYILSLNEEYLNIY